MGRLRQRLSRPVDIAGVAAFRVLLGLVMLVAVIRFAAYGWIDALYVEPAYLFSYWGFEWLPRLPAAGMTAVFVALGGLALMIAAGLYYRAAAVLFFLLFGYVELLAKSAYLNHYYFVSIVGLLMIFMPLHGALSLDAWRRPAVRRTTVPAWVPWTLRLQLGVVYTFAGIAKLNADWLLHAQPLRIWLEARGDLWLVGPWLSHDAVAYAMAWGGALFDLTIFGWLCWRRTRRYAYAAVVGFHLVTGALFPIGMFPWIMIAAALIFFPEDWP
ncbi:MAG: HTTM domain-containing protein, partial [Myxococcales bacterium]|nr:HTTM domain-containing protein [Myxococcales bacterium]